MQDRKAVICSLEESRQELVALAKSLTSEQLQLPTENEGWSVKDTLAHVASSEGGLLATVNRILGGQVATRPGFDLNAYNQQQVEKRRNRSVDELLAELDASRPEALKRFGELTDEQLATRGNMASGTPIDVISVFQRIGDHERLHCDQIRKAIGK
ncbi:MAG: DinB family protein [Chloroflexi bacterium]|nr:DinB family protein [Chloroflexota bacterium]MDA8189346.1 DinB family protein [Dehalococcoidales bacterium]